MDTIRSALAEPTAPHPPGPRRRDWLVVGLVVAAILIEAGVSTDVVWRPIVTLGAVGLALVLPWRRVQPLVTLAVTFGLIGALSVAGWVAVQEPTDQVSMIYVLVLPYSLMRWGSGRQVLLGLAWLIPPVALGIYLDWTGLDEAIGGVAVLLASLALGAAVRNRASSRSRQVEQMKLLERQELARELHDTVAHHVSAIVIQAQAGRTLAPSQSGAAVAALEVIEAAASETLADMRAMVRILRDGQTAELAPQGGVASLHQLADRSGQGPRVDFELSADLNDLSPSVDAAIYRLVQESLTNAVRHASRASRVVVRLGGEGEDAVRLVVHDDGDTTHIGSHRPLGYGLVGMAERARLLGGTCDAGPDPSGGWTVTAVLPRHGRG